MRVKKILVPTDLSVGADSAQALAAVLARVHGAELFLFHAVLSHAHEFRQLGDLLSDFLEKLENEARERLEKETAQLREAGLVARYAVEQHASAYPAILEQIESWKPDLIVMGTHGRSGMERWFLGSVAEKVVRHAPCAVATVRPEAKQIGPGLDRILVPVDFSENARRAVGAAVGIKGDSGTLILQHVVLNPAFAGLHPGEYLRIFNADPGLRDRILERMEDWMEGEPFEADVRESEDIAESILDAAEEQDASLIVMGTRGLTGLDYLLMGSVAEKVVRSSPVPVLTIK